MTAKLADTTVVSLTAFASQLNYSPRTVMRKVRRGELPPPLDLPGRPRWSPSDVQRVLSGAWAPGSRHFGSVRVSRHTNRLRRVVGAS